MSPTRCSSTNGTLSIRGGTDTPLCCTPGVGGDWGVEGAPLNPNRGGGHQAENWGGARVAQFAGVHPPKRAGGHPKRSVI